jgi:hypothetical protein
MSVTANLTTNVETITATIVVEDETIIAQVSAAARGPAGEAGAAGAAGPNTLTTATTTNLDGFISGNGTNISGATAAATAATANTLVMRDGSGGASFAGITLSGINSNSGSYSQVGGANFNVATTTAANLTATGSGTVTVSGEGGTTISGGTLTFSPSAPIEQRNGNAAQESRIYGTYTGPGNYRRLALKMSTAGVAQIVAEGGGSGAVGNRIEIDGLRIGKGGSDVATNTALGASALNANTTGGNNTAVGNLAINTNTTGSSNSAVGFGSLFGNTTGSSNSAFGGDALLNNTTGANNSAFGSAALRNNGTGGSNSAVGFAAGRFIANGTTANAITANSVYLGADTKALASNQTNQIVIGHNAIGLGSNTAVLGNDSIVTTALKGNVGIGTTSPAQKLDVVGSIKASGTIQTGGYTFDTLPTPAIGMRAYITDGAALPLYMANAAGGGSTVTPVFYNGSNWINA